MSYFFDKDKFIKREIDITVFSPNKKILRYAIELKFPRNGQYPEQMFSFCKDIRFAEQLKKSGFKQAFLIIFADDACFYSSGKGNGIYSYFRQVKKLSVKKLSGSIQKPTGRKDKTITLKGSYKVKWISVGEKLRYTVIKANNSK